MKLPPITDFHEKSIKALMDENINFLDPLPVFNEFAQRYGQSLQDDPQFSEPLYHDFEDYDYLHDTSTLEPVYLNDFDFNLEEDRERLGKLTRMDFSGNTFDTVATCGCGELRGNYLLGSERTCNKCGDKVERFLERGEDVKLWLRKPEGVKAFLNIGFYNTFFSSLKIKDPNTISLVEYFVNPIYRKQEDKRKTRTIYTLKNILTDLGINEINLNSFYDNCDLLMEYFLIGPGKKYSGLGRKSEDMYRIYQKYRHVAFCNYIKVPNRYSTIIERVGNKEVYCAEGQLETTQLYYAIAETLESSQFHQLNEKEVLRNVESVGKNLVKLSVQYAKFNNPTLLFKKKAMSRKHVCSGSFPFTGRSIITSQTGIMNPGVLVIPWRMAIAIMKIHIQNTFYRQGLTPWKALRKLNMAAYKVDSDIDAIFERIEKERKGIVESGRMPSIEYLSLSTFFMMVNRSVNDESIKIPISACSEKNA